MIKDDPKTVRREARIATKHKNPISKAPARSVRQLQAMTLSARDREVFIAGLLKAPAPVARLRKAARRYKKQVGK